jgi:predicted nucleic acid-binding protein
MTRAVLADSGPLFAIADENDGLHDRALREFELLAHNRREIVVPYPVLMETFTLVLFRLGRKSASDWLSQVLSAAFINPTPEDYRRAATQVLALGEPSVTRVDSTVAAIGSRFCVEVLSNQHNC